MRFRKAIAPICALALLAVLLGSALAAPPEEAGTPMRAEAIAGGLLEANSNRQVHPFSTQDVESSFDTRGFEEVGRTDAITVFLNRDECALRVKNNETGYVWGALPLGEAEGLNSSWRSYGNSLVAVECFNAEGIESRLGLSKNASVSFTLLDGGLECFVNYTEVGISFRVKVSWSGNRLTMELVDGTLVEGADGSPYTIKSMTFLPFFGCSYSDSVDGYMLIPDGCGGLIRFRKPANYASTYAARIYGADLGIDSKSADLGSIVPEKQALMPIYGVVHGAWQNGFLAVVDEGAEYASILATPAQTNNPYNWAAARFEFRQKYVKNINRKEGAGATVPQETANVLVPKISFYFTQGQEANYDGFAVMYRDMLLESGVLTPLATTEGVPMQLELLGAAKKKNFLWNTTKVMTTAGQAAQIVSSLHSAGITNLDVVWRNYTKNNESGAKRLTSIGDGDEFAALEAAVTGEGGALYYYLDPVTANADQITLRTEAANNLSTMVISWNDTNAMIYTKTYLYRLTEAQSRVEKAIDRDYGGEFALAEITSRLYGDYTSGKELPRAAAKDKIEAIVGALTSGGKTAMYAPNQYLWKNCDKMFTVPVSNSQLLYESDCVPFLQIVLSGCVEMFGTSINTTSYSEEHLLRLIEYGMAPAFSVTGCESEELYRTALQSFFSTNYGDWKDQIERSYAQVSEGLSSVWGRSIVSHECIRNGLIKVGYDNGAVIYLNYTDMPLAADGVEIEAGSFRVIEG